MEAITIYTENTSDIQFFLTLAERLGAKVKHSVKEMVQQESTTNNSKLFATLREIRNKKGFTTSFGEPTEWQKETRRDKILLNRE